MMAHPFIGERAADSPTRMARWRQWLFNRLAHWEEASIAHALGLPVEQVIFVDPTDPVLVEDHRANPTLPSGGERERSHRPAERRLS
jgi:hypothetical protein